MQGIRHCAQLCCGCSRAKPVSFCEHTGRETSGPVVQHHCERQIAKLMQPSHFQPVVPVLPPCYSKALLLPLLLEEAEPPKLLSRHMMEKQGSVAKGKMKGQLERQINRHPNLVYLQQHTESETYLTSIGKR